MTQLVQPRIRVTPGELDVEPGKPFVLQVTVKNTTAIIDAFEIDVLGVDEEQVRVVPELVSLFPDTDETLAVEVTLPDDFPVERTELWVKVTSCTDPVVFAMERVEIDVASITKGTISIDPGKAVGRGSGRFGVTLHNSGNATTDLLLVGSDEENHFTFRFDRERVRLAPGATTSVQAVVRGRRTITGPAVPRPFTITAEASGHQMSDDGMLEQKPWIPQLALMLAAVLALLGLWAVVVGAAIDKIVDDSDSDLSSSFEDGVGAVVDGLDADQAAEAALGDAQADVLASRAGADDGTAGTGIEVAPDAAGDGTSGEGGADGGTAGDGSGGDAGAGGDTTTDPGASTATSMADGGPIAIVDPTRPTIEVAPGVLAGYVVAAADAVEPTGGAPRPVPGAGVTIQALLDNPALPAGIDPNRDPVEVVADEQGVFESPSLIAGTYAVTFSTAGYLDVVCPNVTIPVPEAGDPLGTCAAGSHVVLPGASSIVGLAGDTASIAGIATLGDDPQAGVEVLVRRLDQTTGEPADVAADTSATTGDAPAADDMMAMATTGDDGRFSFVFGADRPPATPGVFELVFVVASDVAARQVVPLEAGENVVGLQVPISPMTSTEARSLSGTITGGDTQAGISNATVTITGVGGSWEIATLADGTYGLDDMPAGTYNVSASATGYLAEAGEATVPTADGEAAVVDIELDPDPDQSRLPADVRRITGTVTSRSGPVPNATVTITSANGTWSVSTLADGTYRLEDLQPGLHNVAVAATGFASDARQVTVPGSIDDPPAVANFVLAPAQPTVPASVRSISGTVRGPAGPVPGATVTITGPSGTSTLTTLDDGTYRREDLTPGVYNIAVSSPLYEPRALQRTVSGEVDGAPAIADFLLVRRRTTISGTVTSSSGPLGVATVRDGGGGVIARTDAAGNWTTDTTFAAGELTLRVDAADHVAETLTVAVDPTQPAPLDVDVELIRMSDWAPTIGTPITASLLAPTLTCVEGPGGAVYAPTSATPVITRAVWTPPPTSSAVPTDVGAQIVTAGSGQTTVEIGRLPDRGTLELTIGGGPVGLYASKIGGIDVASRPEPLRLDFLGTGGVFSDDPLAFASLGVGSGAPCPSVTDGPISRTPVRRTFVVGELGTESSVFLVNQLTSPGATTISSGGATWIGLVPAPAPWFRLVAVGV